VGLEQIAEKGGSEQRRVAGENEDVSRAPFEQSLAQMPPPVPPP
jgi:hypothetical protein